MCVREALERVYVPNPHDPKQPLEPHISNVLRPTQRRLFIEQRLNGIALQYQFPLISLLLKTNLQLIAAAEAEGKDPLTGLFNRRGAYKSIQRLLEKDPNMRAALLLIDLDKFKEKNELYGYQGADKLLTAVARVLSEEVRPSDLRADLPTLKPGEEAAVAQEEAFAGRFGGEEKLIILPGLDSMEFAVMVAERVRSAIQAVETTYEKPDGSEHLMRCTASIGVELGRMDEILIENGKKQIEPGTLLTQADTAVKMAKEGGRNRVVPFQPLY